jgi:hypothetical protein
MNHFSSISIVFNVFGTCEVRRMNWPKGLFTIWAGQVNWMIRLIIILITALINIQNDIWVELELSLIYFSFTQPFTHSKFCLPNPFLFGAPAPPPPPPPPPPAINNDRSTCLKTWTPNKLQWFIHVFATLTWGTFHLMARSVRPEFRSRH